MGEVGDWRGEVADVGDVGGMLAWREPGTNGLCVSPMIF